MAKLSVNELLRRACIYAERDQESLIDCCAEWEGDVKKEAEEFVKQIHEYRMRRWGETKLEAVMDSMVPVSIFELMARKEE